MDIIINTSYAADAKEEALFLSVRDEYNCWFREARVREAAIIDTGDSMSKACFALLPLLSWWQVRGLPSKSNDDPM